jgi:hypothetical protein
MATNIEEIKARAAATRAALAAATLSDDEEEEARILAEDEENRAELRTQLAKQRGLVGRRAEATARTKAGGKYLVRYVDLAALLTDADADICDTLPGRGVLVVRSPPTAPQNSLAIFYRELEAKVRSWPEIYADLALACVVYPDPNGTDGSGALLRSFFESSLGQGTAIPVGDICTQLGGASQKAAKRGR